MDNPQLKPDELVESLIGIHGITHVEITEPLPGYDANREYAEVAASVEALSTSFLAHIRRSGWYVGAIGASSDRSRVLIRDEPPEEHSPRLGASVVYAAGSEPEELRQ